MYNRPNILWIVTTQWRASSVGYEGDLNVRTPWLDGFQSEATNYCQAITPHPFGPQARASLLTGRRSPENGVAGYWDSLPTGTRTIAHAMQDRGYATAFFGKWHLGLRNPLTPFVGTEHAKTIVSPDNRGGFELWEGFESGFLLNDPWLHGTRLPLPRQFKGYQAEVLLQRAAEWLKPPGSRPRFCIVSLEAPHPPYHALAPNVAERLPAEIQLRKNVPRGGSVETKARDELAGYYAHIEAIDRSIGKIFAELDWSTIAAVITSVHGDMHGSHGLFRKGWPYEESVRVPMLVKHPGRSETTGKNEDLVSLTDLPYMALAWAEEREWLCQRRYARISMPEGSKIPLQCERAWFGLRNAARKLILNSDGTPWLYFDLAKDPFELENLVDQRARQGEIESCLNQLANDTRDHHHF